MRLRFITRRGIGFTVSAVALFVIGDVTRTGWVQIADSLFWGAIVVSVMVAAISSGGLTASPRFSSRSHAINGGAPSQGQDVEVEVEVVNRWPVPRFGVTVRYDLLINDRLTTKDADQKRTFHIPFIAPRATALVRGKLQTQRRGVHRLTNGVAYGDAPFGLFKRTQRQPAEASVLVVPAPVEVEFVPSKLAVVGERPRPATARTGEEVVGSRPYVVGDAARSIHWRNSARAGRLMTKAYSATENETPVLIVGPGMDSDAQYADQRLDDRCRIAAGVAWLAGQSGVPLAVLVGLDERHLTWGEMLSHLGSLTPETVPAMAEQLRRVSFSSSLAVIVDAADDESVDALGSQAARFPAVEVWLLADEGDDHDWRANRVASVLRGAGAQVSIVHRPLAAPEVSR
jgi:uncharacterized protein (DUF58 family)